MNIEEIQNKEDCIIFIKILMKLYPENHLYLESVVGWLEDFEQGFINNNKDIPKNINWSFLALTLQMGCIYD